MWTDAADRGRKCTRCVEVEKVERGSWKCIACKNALAKVEFSNWLATRTSKKSNGKQRCNGCFADEERRRKEVAERSCAM
eukprot:3309833-Pyramimonas_sp.AAC.1